MIQLSLEALGSVATVLSAAGAMWAAREARKAALATKDAAEAALVKQFLDDYFEPDMATAVRIVRQWQSENGEHFAAKWISKLAEGDEEAKIADLSRRKIKGYFTKAAQIYENGLIRPKTFRAIAYVGALNTFYDIIEPLDIALNPQYIPNRVLASTIGRFRDIDHIRSVPP